jgi:hypothetical protein
MHLESASRFNVNQGRVTPLQRSSCSAKRRKPGVIRMFRVGYKLNGVPMREIHMMFE